MEVEKELWSHALDLQDECHARGFAESDIESEIMKRLGDSVELESQLKVANERPWQRWVSRVIALGVVASLLATLTYVGISYQHSQQRMRLAQIQMRSAFPEFENDERELSSLPFLKKPSGKRDLLPFMQDHLRARPLPPIAVKFIKRKSDAELFKGTPPKELVSADLGWMHELSSSTFHALSFADIFDNSLKMSVVLDLTRVYLVQSVISGNAAQGINDVVSFAQILHGDQTVLGEMIGDALLRYANVAQDEARRRGLIHKNNEYLPTLEQVERLKRAELFMAGVVVNLETPTELEEKLLDHPEWRIGLCSSLNEALRSYMQIYARYFKPDVQFNGATFAEKRLWLEQMKVREAGKCGLEDVDAFVVAHQKDYLFGDAAAIPKTVRLTGVSIPGLRVVLGLITADRISFRHFDDYPTARASANN